MGFPPQSVINDLKKYQKLPATQEKKNLDKLYLSDEIGSLEFYSLAMEYMRKVNDTTPQPQDKEK